jgi:hypothetical protein
MKIRLPSGDEVRARSSTAAWTPASRTQRDVSRTKRDIKTFEIRPKVDNKDRRLAVGMTTYVEPPHLVSTIESQQHRQEVRDFTAVDGVSFKVEAGRSSAARSERRRQVHAHPHAGDAAAAHSGSASINGFDVVKKADTSAARSA